MEANALYACICIQLIGCGTAENKCVPFLESAECKIQLQQFEHSNLAEEWTGNGVLCKRKVGAGWV